MTTDEILTLWRQGDSTEAFLRLLSLVARLEARVEYLEAAPARERRRYNLQRGGGESA